jgi:hypothetical protein
MATKHRIVISAENNPYTGWQAKLFYYSCVTRLGQQPIVIVHDNGTDWQPDFFDLVRAGCIVRGAPSYRSAHPQSYYPRNTAGTLLHAAELCDDGEFIVLFDPDMIFVRRTSFPEALAAARYYNMNYDRDEVTEAGYRLGITRESIDRRAKELSCGVPYVIPAADAHWVAEAWLEAIDAFPSIKWGDMMHAFGLVVIKLGLPITITNNVDHNFWPLANLNADIIHYGYGDDTWNKRHYFTREQAHNVWVPQVSAPRGTVLGEIITQLKEAGDFYSQVWF